MKKKPKELRWIPEALIELLEEYNEFYDSLHLEDEERAAADYYGGFAFQTEFCLPRFTEIVAIIKKRKEALDAVNLEKAEELRLDASKLALKELRRRGLQSSLEEIRPEYAKGEIKLIRDYCNSLLKALDGKIETTHTVKWIREEEKERQDEGRFLSAATDFIKKNGKKPTKQDLRDEYGIRGEFLTIAGKTDYLAAYLRKGKRGPKPRS